jgi:hypothetical protein
MNSRGFEPREGRKFFARRDILAVLCLLALSCVIYLCAARGSEGARAEVTVDGEVVAALFLGENRVYSPPRMPGVRIAVRDGAAGFVASDCTDKVCVHTGFLSLRGQSAVCLPNRVVVRVLAGEGEQGETLDGVAY